MESIMIGFTLAFASTLALHIACLEIISFTLDEPSTWVQALDTHMSTSTKSAQCPWADDLCIININAPCKL